jgi:hypothetical protein
VEGDLDEDMMGVPARSERCKARLLEIGDKCAMIERSAVKNTGFLFCDMLAGLTFEEEGNLKR